MSSLTNLNNKNIFELFDNTIKNNFTEEMLENVINKHLEDFIYSRSDIPRVMQLLEELKKEVINYSDSIPHELSDNSVVYIRNKNSEEYNKKYIEVCNMKIEMENI